jgi:hypothetical protein
VIRYIEILVSINKDCLLCHQAKSQSSKSSHRESALSLITGLKSLAEEDLNNGIISPDYCNDVFDFICEMSIGCNDCNGKERRINKIVEVCIKPARERALGRIRRLESKELAKRAVASSQGKLIEFPMRK